MNLQTLFQRQNETVRDNAAVLVKREVKEDGAVLYRKSFKQQGYNIWAERENRFFSLFNFKNAKQVVRPHTMQNTEHGNVSVVVTFDAGLSIEEWIRVGISFSQDQQLDDPFLWGDHLVRLAHACLSALHEIHRLGIIHCDIKPDNICVPYTPKDIQKDIAQEISIDFANLRLIDFSFSLSKEIPLEHATLPMDSQHHTASYMAPVFRQALRNDQVAGTPHDVNQLDYRIDLYSLGYMLGELSNRPNVAWQHPAAAATLQKIIQEMQGSVSLEPMPHTVWMQQLAQCFDTQIKFKVIAKQGQTQQVAAATPLTPLLTTPLIVPTAPQNPVESTAAPASTSTQRNQAEQQPKAKSKTSKIILWSAISCALLGGGITFDVSNKARTISNIEAQLSELSAKTTDNIETLNKQKLAYDEIADKLKGLSNAFYPWVADDASKLLKRAQKSIKLIDERVAFVQMQDALEHISERIQSYDDAISQLETILKQASTFKKNYPSSKFEITKLTNEVKAALNNTKREYGAFKSIELLASKPSLDSAEAESAINTIEDFLSAHPNSLLKKLVLNQRDIAESAKIKIMLEQDFSSIAQLNSVLAKARHSLQNIQSSENVERASALINDAAKKAEAILVKEVEAASKELEHKMQAEAFAVAHKAHFICQKSSDSIELVSENSSQSGVRTTWRREYKVLTQGDFLCKNTYSVSVVVDAHLDARIENGADYAVTSANVTSDAKL